MSMREFQNSLLVIDRQPPFVKKYSSFILTQVPQRDDTDEVLPPAIALPGNVRGVAPCQYCQNSVGELRQQGCTQPGIERRQCLISVDENHRSSRRGIQEVRYGGADVPSQQST